MKTEYNKRAAELAEEHSRMVKKVVHDILYWIYSFFIETTYQKSKSINETYLQLSNNVNNVDVVALFVSSEGERLCMCLQEQGHLDSSVTRDLYSYTKYMWSGSKESEELRVILNLFNDQEEESDIPQMDFYVILAPVRDTTLLGTSREDTANRVVLFETLCKNKLEIKVSNRIKYSKLPKDIVFVL